MMKTEVIPFDLNIPIGFGAFFNKVILISSGISLGSGGLYNCIKIYSVSA